MALNTDHRILAHLDHPKRYFGLTVDELSIALVATLFIALSSQKVIVILSAFLLVAGLKRLKKNQGPRFLLVLAYWYLPHKLTRFILPKLPDSASRYWIS
ncbi:type IV conjugative transfer system protein TraL (plasmid) [Legionella israelensis]|uniref:type IV conjugative transfer system protein TraL n=1 Tax=Legionella israelensis TaxID=454 RepID=UPI00117CB608|nr:type IV conjugative transfer system protein TraL [Legionella israelensis]QDP73715.1 type IV conjugative transfer system protein TraL [Legionella israelensis]